MKISAIVLRNKYNALQSLDYEQVLNAFLSGGVFFDEVALLPYDSPAEISATLIRMKHESGALVVVCDEALLPSAREVIAQNVAPLSGNDLCEEPLVALLPTGEKGAIIASSLVIPAIDKKRGKRYSRMVVRTVGVPLETLREALDGAKALSGEHILYNVSEKYADTRIEAVYDSATPKMLADDVLRLFCEKLKGYVYAVEDISLAERLVDALKLHRLKIATAESFTGGGVGRAIVRVSGASAVFYEGLNTYDNRSKEERLGVSPYTLKSHGAVSDEVAYEMAVGLLKGENCDLAIATTGIAGPNSDGTQKPVGLCYLAVGTKERVRVFRLHLDGDRETITQTAINLALFYAYQEIK